MNKLTKYLDRSTVILLLCSFLLPGLSLGTDIDPVDRLNENLYIDVISAAKTELQTASEHRTWLADRLDHISRELSAVQHRKDSVSAKQNPLIESVQKIDKAINNANLKIRALSQSLVNNQNRLNNSQMPSLLATALKKPQATKQRRQIAVLHYLIHKTQQSVQQANRQKLMLTGRKQELLQSEQELSNSLGELTLNRQDKIDERRLLEQEFARVSADIVVQQDRVATLQSRLSQIRSTPDSLQFAAQRGSLPDPTQGILQHRFAEPKAKGLLQWDGILVEAPADQEINVVFDGTVVFADHMQGLGNVTIIDHGDGYMSLYGMADYLVVETGQFVISGDTLGAVGQPVGTTGSRLYFEIRHNATTLDPQDWLAMTNISPN
ncbi:hypothetical protein AB833_16620 [Chromatiales bacterium (ex Bugula neritina AB1)]|nr:hypothetical protein AB833_16620 [Chromatiales bacterium (ex Bugula neritina AB1)]